jgi:DNA-binding HxlR family transcriptional regulator
MDTKHGQSAFCPIFHKSVELIGRRWTGAIIRAMQSGRTRFSDIAHAVPGLSDRLLSERLKELEAEHIVTRTVFPETPVRIEYELTEKGRDLDVVMLAISDWSARWVELDAGEECAAPECVEESEAEPAALS